MGVFLWNFFLVLGGVAFIIQYIICESLQLLMDLNNAESIENDIHTYVDTKWMYKQFCTCFTSSK